nr:AMP-binding protein [Piscirickettsia litoralis]
MLINPDGIAVHLSTSGSSGTPTLHAMSWRRLLTLAQTTAQHFKHWQGSTILATVPSQHMYGLEHRLFWALPLQANVHDQMAQLPSDILKRLSQLGTDSILITTPFHLNACVQSGLNFPNIRGVLSATAPLSQNLAKHVEALFKAPVYEIYGSTETGAIATRQAAYEQDWQLFSGRSIIKKAQRFYLSQTQSDGSPNILTELHDTIENITDNRFTLGPRSNDLIKVAGKRASLAELHHTVKEISGIKDAAFYLPEQESHTKLYQRLILFVCFDEKLVTTTMIKQKIKQYFDPIFVPKEIYKLEELPRNEVSKLTLSSLKELLERCRHEI